MKVIKVLGTGCAKCQTTKALVEEVARELGLEITVDKVEDVAEIVRYGVMSTPAVVVDGKVMHAGGLPEREKIAGWLKA